MPDLEDDTRLKISFRFLALNEHQAGLLRAENIGAKMGTHFKTKDIVGSVPLTFDSIVVIKKFIETHSIAHEEHDIFLSVRSSFDSRILDIPPVVNEAVKELGARLVLSYTIA